MPSIYSIASVVLVHYSWKDERGNIRSKPRPCIIKEILSGNKYLITKITTVNKAEKLILVKCTSANGQEMGLLLDSYISVNETQIVNELEIIRKIGTCPISLFCQL